MGYEIYKTKLKSIAGTSYSEVVPKARNIYKNIASKTKRKPYIRSKVFSNEKVFLDYFWGHIMTKNQGDRFRRLKLYNCAIDLIKNSRIRPESIKNPNKHNELLHRFEEQNANNEYFIVQIKEELSNGQKHFMSVFPK